MDIIKNQTNIYDEELIKKVYEECNKDEFATILKLLDLEEKQTPEYFKNQNSADKKDVEMFRKIMNDKETFFYNKINKETTSK
jgi:hypothetical protein